MNAIKSLLSFLFVISIFVSSSDAQIVGTHSGLTNPLDEGWTKVRSFSGVGVGPDANDFGFDDWAVQDSSTFGDGIYVIQLTAQQLAAAAVSDWHLSTRLRVVDNLPSSSAGGHDAVTVDIHFLEQSYGMVFGKESNGFPSVGLATVSDPIWPTVNNLNQNYNSYDLYFSHATNSASLYVNGTLAYSGYTGGYDPDINAPPGDRTAEYLFFGSTASFETGRGNYNFVQFEIIPEPSTAMLAAFGGLILLKRRRS